MAERRMFDELLQAFRRGEISEEQAGARILEMFYEGKEHFLLDMEREQRLGFPEIVYAEAKRLADLLEIVARMLETKGKAFVAAVSPEAEGKLQETFHAHPIRTGGRVMVIGPENGEKGSLGTAGVITAGTSDIPYAEECALLLEELGVRVVKSFDAGVAGIHRPLMSLRKMTDARVLVAFAGMEGALPSVVGGLVDVPVIAVPTSVGYGAAFDGLAALLGMLNSCASGVVVVNIDNGFGAGRFAAILCRMCASAES